MSLALPESSTPSINTMGGSQDPPGGEREPAILLFGSQVDSFTKESLAAIQKTLRDEPSRQWILDTLEGLPSYLDALPDKVPDITNEITTGGKRLLSDLVAGLRRAPADGTDDLGLGWSASLPSILLSPLVVLAQVVQYRQYLTLLQQQHGEAGDPQAALAAREKKPATLGFCMGLLGAYAVASSGTQAELDKYGAVAVRLGLVGGALIDAQQQRNPSKSYATAWVSEKQRDDVRRVVDGLHPEAYVSVLYDEARATVTTSQRAAAKLLRQLRAAGIATAEVGVRGDIHSPRPESRNHVEALITFCNGDPGLRFPDASSLALPSYTNAGDGEPVAAGAGPMHEIALRTVFSKQCDWYGTSAAVVKAAYSDQNETGLTVSFGPDRCVPPTLLRQLGSRLLHFADADLGADNSVPEDGRNQQEPAPQTRNQEEHDGRGGTDTAPPRFTGPYAGDEAIAVVGMSIKVAGADDVDEFSAMLRTGASQHQVIPPERMTFDSSPFRERDPSRTWYANLMRDVDAFDHKFFKRSPRESAAMDPQQRLLLQAAYQAVEQAGYFTEEMRNPHGAAAAAAAGGRRRDRRHVGVYIGAPAVDYEHNVAGHAANAFTATGNLQSFLAGRVAHQFGWTGPAMTLDTACSSSAVAVHTACRNLAAGECDAALAGGVALFTNPLWFQNLAAANFLSPTGQCRPFDRDADGFCRAEGVACVFLKRMADAVADGSPILGCVASSAVYQNRNSTPLFVPNSPSLSQLFRDVVRRANVGPGDVSLVEAHGTGTPVGDPAEYEAIRAVFGGAQVRSKPLPLGSAKGHVGHTEGASGVVSLIKVLAMMRENYIPPQASFTKMSPLIRSSPEDKIEVVTSLRPWSRPGDEEASKNKVALINNYGAGGSNAAMVVSQLPIRDAGFATPSISDKPSRQGARLPFFISGLDARGIQAYASKLNSFLQSASSETESRPPLSLADVSFALNRHSNPNLGQRVVFSARSVEELRGKLSDIASSPSEPGIEKTKPERPVILCFGGQVSTFVGLDRELYDGAAILRRHLDECDALIRSLPLGLGSMFPDIFSRTPFDDPVRLQTMLFSLQYSSARSWMDSGLSGKVAATVGHSFGELTALCISGVLSLRDAIELVAGRARLVRDAWGSDSGAMMAVEADESLLRELIAQSEKQHLDAGHHPASIACFNGPRSFTLAGSSKAVDAVAETLATDDKFSAVRHKKLNVTNAFHSSLVDPLVGPLGQIGKRLVFQAPSIPFESATETRLSGPLTPDFVPDHMRKPVFFRHAIQRLAREHPSAVFLEAGSNSTVTVMASRALAGQTMAPPGSEPHVFQAVNISNGGGMDGLTDATVSLQKQGVRVSLWAHHATQTRDYAPLLLPPYQFEKTRHWLELKSTAEAVATAAARLAGTVQPRYKEDEVDERHLGLFTFVGYRDKRDKRTSRPRFRINAGSDKYKKLISGHLIAQTAPVCPGTLQIDMAIEALFSIRPDWRSLGLQPVLHDMANHAPLCVDPTRTVWLDLESVDAEETRWEWNISSAPLDGVSTDKDTRLHVDGRFHVRSSKDEAFVAEFSRFERLVNYSSCAALLATAGRDGDEDGVDVDVLQGRNVYRAFSEFVDYSETYRGVKSVVGRSDECAGRVHRRRSGDTWLDVLLDDCFGQVSGLWVNCMTDIDPSDMYIATGCEMLMRSPRGVLDAGQTQDTWHVYARSTRRSDTAYTTDVFVFNAANGQLAELLLGIQYTQVPKASMRKMLLGLTRDASVVVNSKQDVPAAGRDAAVAGRLPVQRSGETSFAGTNGHPGRNKKKQARKQRPKSAPDMSTLKGASTAGEVRRIVATVAGMQAGDITLETQLADVGIDSLMGMELRREIDLVFKVAIDQADLLQATSVGQLVDLVSRSKRGIDQTEEEEKEEDDDGNQSSSDQDGWSSANRDDTPASPADTGSSAPLETGKTASQQGDAGYDLNGDDILECFGDVKLQTDRQLVDLHLDNIDRVIIAATSRLTAALITEAFEQLGCSLRTIPAGANVERVPHLPQYERLMEWAYGFLETDARLVDIDAASGRLTRTAVAVPPAPSEAVLQDLLKAQPDWEVASRLIYHAGKPLAQVLSGETDGIRILFGSAEGRELVAALYRDHPFNIMLAGQMRDLIHRLSKRVQGEGPLRILEMGAGTGGTTVVLVPFLASLDIPVEYTFTDLSPSMVAAARRKFGKQYPWMRFAVHDIEKPPAEDLRGQQIVVASNAVHATHDLVVSATNVRQALRPDGFLMLLEQTECMPFSNLIFGLLEGWWLFDDGRTHAIVSTERWERDLQASGFGHVDWTDGHLPENNIQRVIVALASGPVRERLPIPDRPPREQQDATMELAARDVAAREAEAEKYVSEYTTGWESRLPSRTDSGAAQRRQKANVKDAVIAVTGATGSLGSHLVAAFAENPSVKTVVCINRRSSSGADARQEDALSKRGISLSPDGRSKLRVLETDTSRPFLGLDRSDYDWLVGHVTHIVHNAWPMSGTRPIAAFEPQFQAMRNLLDLARDIVVGGGGGGGDNRDNNQHAVVGFQLVTSIGVVAKAGVPRVPEGRVPIASVLPTGYCEGKWVCERMLEQTLHRYPGLFRPMVVRPGQIAGSTNSGFWNPVEHFAFMVKSAQSLGAWPDLEGRMQWVPVDQSAAAMAELLYVGNEAAAPEPCPPVYHIDNPVGQSWKDMSPVLAEALGVPPEGIVPFRDWLRRVSRSPLSERENPAAQIMDFLDRNFERMSCGRLILDTSKAQEHSKTMAGLGPPCGACQKRGHENSCRFEPAPKQQLASSSSFGANQNRIRTELSQMQHVLQRLLNQPGQTQAQPGSQVEIPCRQLMETIDRIRNTLEDDARPRPLTNTAPDEQHLPDLVFASFGKATLRDIMAALPSRQVADRTISAYFNAKHVTVPFIHTHQFRRQYEAFWSDPAATNLLWVSILFSVLATGAVVLGAKAASTSDPHHPSAYVTLSARCLVAGQYQKAAEFSVEALVMHAHSRSFQRSDRDVDMSQLQALALRLAQRRCYHRDVDELQPAVTPFEAEMRRRVWYVIQYYDVLFSLEQGLPPLIHEDTFSTRHPTNATDDDFDEHVLCLTPRPIEKAQPMLPCVCISHLLPILRRIIRHALGFKACTYSDAMSLEAELEAWHASIPPCLRIRAIKDTSFTDPNHTVMQRIMLELIYIMGTVLLYRPFLDLMKPKNRERQVALNVCRRLAVRSVGVYVEVDREMQEGGRLYDDQPVASGLSFNDFLITTIVAPLEFFDCPNLPPGEEAYIINLLQTATQLWSKRSVASTHARESTRLLRLIAAKAQTASQGRRQVPRPVSSSSVATETETEQYEHLALQQYPSGEGGSAESDTAFEVGLIDWDNAAAIDWDSVNFCLNFDTVNQPMLNNPFLNAQ
ncbi:hypothetical protein LZ31DRAFT_632527 [Colletotrichum somersetense]|nr:hypothetical protein LZ31DRAFT_632527 [Colletotrichum somersetense]